MPGHMEQGFCGAGASLEVLSRNSSTPGFPEWPWQVGQGEQEAEMSPGWFSEVSSLLEWQLQERFML